MVEVWSTYTYASANPVGISHSSGLGPTGRTAPSPASPGFWWPGPFDQSWSQAPWAHEVYKFARHRCCYIKESSQQLRVTTNRVSRAPPPAACSSASHTAANRDDSSAQILQQQPQLRRTHLRYRNLVLRPLECGPAPIVCWPARIRFRQIANSGFDCGGGCRRRRSSRSGPDSPALAEHPAPTGHRSLPSSEITRVCSLNPNMSADLAAAR